MYRIFSRIKTVDSIRHKLNVKYADRLIVVFSLLSHKGRCSLTYDNLLFMINRIEMMDPEMKKREPEDIKAMLDAYLRS